MKTWSLVAKLPNGRYIGQIVTLDVTPRVLATTAYPVRNRNIAARMGQALKREFANG